MCSRKSSYFTLSKLVYYSGKSWAISALKAAHISSACLISYGEVPIYRNMSILLRLPVPDRSSKVNARLRFSSVSSFFLSMAAAMN